jgi:hypothetical protein
LHHADRNIRQTFKHRDLPWVKSSPFDVTGGASGFKFVFTVEDVNASNWDLTGVATDPLATINYFNSLPASTQRLGFCQRR